MARSLTRAALNTALLLALAQTALAQELADPTRPPPGFGQAETGVPAEAPLLLNALYLVGKAPYAIVDGMTVRAGDRLGDYRVTRIDEHGVWLRGPAGPRQLRLTPGIDKKPAVPGRIKTENTK